MLQIAICDDEQFYREKIRRLLTDYLEKRDLGSSISFFTSGEEFLSQSENNVKYDIVFMDISMDELNGIETAMQMRAFHSDTFLVFVTAFIDYALEGYKANAIRYLMKDTLDVAMGECMDAILQKMRTSQVTFSFIEGERKLYTDNIIYIESSRHKSVFYYMKSEMTHYQIYSRLDAVEQELSGCGFLRIHKSYLVNCKYIYAIEKGQCILDDGKKILLSRHRAEEVKAAFKNYLRSEL